MSISLSNTNHIVTNSLSIITDNRLVNINDIFLSKDEAISNIIGLPVDTMNTLEKISNALNNNPDFFDDNQNAINTKADTNYVNSELEKKTNQDAFISNINFNTQSFENIYTKDESNLLLNEKANNEFVTNNINSLTNYVNTNLNLKTNQDAFISNINLNTQSFLNIYRKSEIDSLLLDTTNNINLIESSVINYVDTNLDLKLNTSLFVENIDSNTLLFNNLTNNIEDRVLNSVFNNALLSISENLNNYQTIDSNTVLLNNRYTKNESNNLLNLKEDILISGDTPNGGFAILTNKVVRGLSVESPLTLSNQGEFLKIGIDSDSINNDNVYSKSDVNSLLTNKQNNILFSNPSNGFPLSNNGGVMKGISVEGALTLVDSQSELKISINENLINQSKFNTIDSSILNIQNNINNKQNLLSSGSFAGVTPILVGSTIKSLLASNPVILTSSANHLSFSLTNDFINKSYAKSETYTRAIIDSGFASLYKTGSESRRFTNNDNQDVLVLNSDKSIELKGNTLNNGTLSVLGNALFSNNLDVLATANIERAIIRNVAVESSGVTFKNNANNDIMRVFSSGLLIQSSLIIGAGATINGFPSPFFCAGKFNGESLEILSSTGQHDFSLSRPGNNNSGVYNVKFNVPHTKGSHYLINTTVQGQFRINIWENPSYIPTQNSFNIVTWNISNVLANTIVYFSVEA